MSPWSPRRARSCRCRAGSPDLIPKGLRLQEHTWTSATLLPTEQRIPCRAARVRQRASGTKKEVSNRGSRREITRYQRGISTKVAFMTARIKSVCACQKERNCRKHAQGRKYFQTRTVFRCLPRVEFQISMHSASAYHSENIYMS